jgi:serine/threonine protein kinase
MATTSKASSSSSVSAGDDSTFGGSSKDGNAHIIRALSHSCRNINDVYDKVNYVSQGTYGLVFKAINKQTNELVAVKQVKLDDSNGISARMGFPITALREINVLLSLNHVNIIKVRKMFTRWSRDV